MKYIILFLFLACRLHAQESMMNNISFEYLDKLIAAAKVNYPKMRMYNHKMDEAKTGISKAKLSWFNAITLTYLYSPSSTSSTVTSLVNPTYTQGYQFALYANLGALLVTAPTVKIAKQEYQIAKDNMDEYNLNIEAIVKERYFNYIKQSTFLNIRSRNVLDVESSLKQIKYKYEKGEETFDSYNKALTMYATAVQTKIEAEGAVLTAKGYLEEICGKLEAIDNGGN